MSELLIGCGHRRDKAIAIDGGQDDWTALTTLDIDPSVKPDIVADLETLPLPFADDSFDEIHAYDVLEHTGRQGDWRFFFAQWSDFWRILRPNGLFFAKVPAHDSVWAWADPGHTRIILEETLIFLSQAQYQQQVGKTAMTDYRPYYNADFEILVTTTKSQTLVFVLRAIKD